MDVLTSVDEARCSELRRDDRFFWLDLVDPEPAELAALGELLGLHALAVEDTREFGQPPKLDHYGDHVLLVFYTARECVEDERIFEPLEVHVYVSGGFVVTVRQHPFAPLDALHDRLDAAMSEEDAVYRILDTLVDALLAVTDRVEVRVDALEAAVLERAEAAHVKAIYRLKQEVRDIERRAFQQHARFDGDIEAILALDGFQAGQRRYLNDVRDHLEQASGALTRQMEDLHMLTETFFNANSQRLNVVVARLSIIAAFFFVWTLVTSFFGQNFGWLIRGIDSRADFLLFGIGGLVVSTLLAAAVLWWRRRDLF